MEIFRGLLIGSFEDIYLRKSIYLLLMTYEADYGSKVIILIDEYNNPFNNSYGRSH